MGAAVSGHAQLGNKMNLAVLRRFQGILECAQAHVRCLYQHGHIAGFMFIAQHFGVCLGDVSPVKTFGHARIKSLFAHQVIGGTCLLKMGKVATLQALLVHPHISHVKCTIEARGAGTNHNHATLFAHQR